MACARIPEFESSHPATQSRLHHLTPEGARGGISRSVPRGVFLRRRGLTGAMSFADLIEPRPVERRGSSARWRDRVAVSVVLANGFSREQIEQATGRKPPTLLSLSAKISGAGRKRRMFCQGIKQIRTLRISNEDHARTCDAGAGCARPTIASSTRKADISARARTRSVKYLTYWHGITALH
jgi:hypothetical protein